MSLKRKQAEEALRESVTERPTAEEALTESETQLRLANEKLESLVQRRTATLRHLSAQLMRLQDEEHRRIARNLHDSLGQYLASIKMNLDSLTSFRYTEQTRSIVRSVGIGRAEHSRKLVLCRFSCILHAGRGWVCLRSPLVRG